MPWLAAATGVLAISSTVEIEARLFVHQGHVQRLRGLRVMHGDYEWTAGAFLHDVCG
jgi:hypothetical protein